MKLGSFTIKEFVGLKPKMYSILVSNSSEYKREKGVNKNVAAKIGCNKCKDVLLKKKYLIEFKVKIIECELMRSTKILCLTFKTKFIFLIMELIC